MTIPNQFPAHAHARLVASLVQLWSYPSRGQLRGIGMNSNLSSGTFQGLGQLLIRYSRINNRCSEISQLFDTATTYLWSKFGHLRNCLNIGRAFFAGGSNQQPNSVPFYGIFVINGAADDR